MNTHEKPDVQHKKSLMLGALISPLAAPLILGLIYGIVILFQGDFVVAIAMPLLFFMFGLPLTYTITFALVLPMAIFLRKKNALSSARLCLWCTLLGPFAFYAYGYLLNSGDVRALDIPSIIFSIFSGFISGVAFCLTAKIRLFAH